MDKALEIKFQKNTKIFKKNVLVRVDLNVPVVKGKISDFTKIYSLRETLLNLIKNKNKIFLLSHFGRPRGVFKKELSLQNIINEIQNSLKLNKLYFVKDYFGKEIEDTIKLMHTGEVCLLENIRFHKEEEKNIESFAEKFSYNFDVYINDAFSASHRSHASIVGITKFLPSYAGLMFEKEINALNSILNKSNKPALAIIGGSKVSTKITILENLVKKLDYLVIAGGMANTFLASKSIDVGLSKVEEKYFNLIKNIENNALESGCRIILPTDVITSKSLGDKNSVNETLVEKIKKNHQAFDIGSQSCAEIIKLFSEVKTVLWNGPLGAFEYKPFDNSTKIISTNLSLISKKKQINVVIGGGDTVSSINNLGVIEDFTYVSTSGGAFLEWLEGKELPGIYSLKHN
ncbi:MAG: Phosphoglycerate kinase [Alphaproteobacteria bacterium MarineAlpha5_Bin12]|nr:MAG: Phosphoglycerate kinase [Alphaproteobacteria bacterium MarineAlpha5_Bin12]